MVTLKVQMRFEKLKMLLEISSKRNLKIIAEMKFFGRFCSWGGHFSWNYSEQAIFDKFPRNL